MSRWFRHYAGMMRDEKLVSAALRSKQPVERVVWVWGVILESAAELNDDGRYEVDFAEMSYFLRATEEDLAAISDALHQLGRLSGGAVAKWGERQFQSDRSAERQQRYRERHKKSGDSEKAEGDGQVTSPSRHSDAPETETYTETEKKVSRRVASATTPKDDDFEEFWKAYPRRKGDNPKQPASKVFSALIKQGSDPKAIIAGVKIAAARNRDKIGTEYIPQAVKWLRDRRWEDHLAQGEKTNLATPERDWRAIVERYRDRELWTAPGPEPGYAGCQAPSDILREFGFLPSENVARETSECPAPT